MKLAKIAFISLLAITVASCGDKANNDHSDAGNDNVDSTATTEAPAATYNIDTEASTVSWKGSVLGVYHHTGTVGLNPSQISTENGAITGGEFTVDLTNIVTTDSNYKKEEERAKLVGHLQTAEFFNTAEHPTATFKITSVEGSTLTGDLTIRGITMEEKVENVSFTEENGTLNATGDLTFDRQKYDVKWNFLKDMTLSDDIELKISLTGKAG